MEKIEIDIDVFSQITHRNRNKAITNIIKLIMITTVRRIFIWVLVNALKTKKAASTGIAISHSFSYVLDLSFIKLYAWDWSTPGNVLIDELILFSFVRFDLVSSNSLDDRRFKSCVINVSDDWRVEYVNIFNVWLLVDEEDDLFGLIKKIYPIKKKIRMTCIILKSKSHCDDNRLDDVWRKTKPNENQRYWSERLEVSGSLSWRLTNLLPNSINQRRRTLSKCNLSLRMRGDWKRRNDTITLLPVNVCVCVSILVLFFTSNKRSSCRKTSSGNTLQHPRTHDAIHHISTRCLNRSIQLISILRSSFFFKTIIFFPL